MPKTSSKKPTTFFQKMVYSAVKKIPKGETLTYKEVASLAGKPWAWRAVGNILKQNRDPEIPCHRVVRSDGRAGGYNRGTKIKNTLLKKEGVLMKKGKIVKV